MQILYQEYYNLFNNTLIYVRVILTHSVVKCLSLNNTVLLSLFYYIPEMLN
jgi:hypothetical protein